MHEEKLARHIDDVQAALTRRTLVQPYVEPIWCSHILDAGYAYPQGQAHTRKYVFPQGHAHAASCLMCFPAGAPHAASCLICFAARASASREALSQLCAKEVASASCLYVFPQGRAHAQGLPRKMPWIATTSMVLRKSRKSLRKSPLFARIQTKIADKN